MVNTRSPVLLLIGNDSYLKEKAIKDLVSSLPGSASKDLDNKVFYGGEAEAGEVLDHINTVPFLASKRLIVIKDLEKASPEFMASLIGYMKKPLSSTCLILETSDGSMLEKYADLSRYARVQRSGPMGDREISSWMKDLLARRGKKINADAADLLKEMYSHDLLLLTQELEKLTAFTGDRPGIVIGDVEEIAGKSLVSSAFDLGDAIGAGKADDALRICRELTASGKKEFEIIGLLCWHFKRLLKAKTLRARGESDNHIASSVRVMTKYRPGFFRQVTGLGMGRIKAGIRALLEADLDIKRTRFDYAHSNLVLEFAVINLCQSTPLTSGRVFS